MVRITVDLVRKRAEHNEMVLSTLEEISLHQLDIEKIEHLHRWCPRLKILLLQGNLIDKIENMHRFRELQYLNLALNNLEYLSGLGNCEALTKLDLTANFIIYLTSLDCLQELPNLSELYLTGNPCTAYRGYRVWLVCLLYPLEELDGTQILRSERIKSIHNFTVAQETIIEDQRKAIEKREAQKRASGNPNKDQTPSSESDESDPEEWAKEMTEHSPEVRVSMHNEIRKRRERHERKAISFDQQPKKEVKFFNSLGKPLNLNKANLDFSFKEDEEMNTYVLEIKTFKYLDTDHITCDVQPQYVRVIAKGQPMQIVFPSEVKADQASAKRSQVTGHLLITAPKVEEDKVLKFYTEKRPKKKNIEEKPSNRTDNYLDVYENNFEDRLKIVPDDVIKNNKPMNFTAGYKRNDYKNFKRPDSPDFINDPNVPPLE